jgi:hypothetical protein
MAESAGGVVAPMPAAAPQAIATMAMISMMMSMPEKTSNAFAPSPQLRNSAMIRSTPPAAATICP